MTKVNKRLGQRIRKLRKEMGITQEELAFRSKIDYSYLNQIENGRRNPTVETVAKIARALKTSSENLLSF